MELGKRPTLLLFTEDPHSTEHVLMDTNTKVPVVYTVFGSTNAFSKGFDNDDVSWAAGVFNEGMCYWIKTVLMEKAQVLILVSC